ncbi:MAG: TetR/AcrR family transcriptional regulator [Caldilineae bacterium]|nr:TetR/AcrR family transcriptional regulator [Caldilineae bacterium]
MQVNDAAGPAQPPSVPEYSETQTRLLQATLSVIYELGIDKATTRRIAERAGVNLQLIQYHFGGKAGLIAAAQDFTRDHFYGLVTPAVAGAPGLASAIRAGLAATWASAREAPELLQPDLLLQVRRSESQGPGERLPSRAASSHVSTLLEALMARTGERLSVPLPRFNALLMSSAAGLLLEYRVSGDPEPVGEAFELLADLLAQLVVAG